MPVTVALEEAQARLAELIEQLALGEEIVITRDERPVAKLIGQRQADQKPRQPGSMKGGILFMADDFDAPLEDFEEYR
jgi:prevent-host-death family protein